MKKMMLMAMMMAIAFSASAMKYSDARYEALYLSDKMAYELGLSMEQYEAVYEINLDYMLSVSHRNDIFGFYWERRNMDLRYVLDARQYSLFLGLNYFYRPIYWHYNGFAFRIYDRYSHRNLFYFDRPKVFVSYKGGHNKANESFYAHRGFDKGNKMVVGGSHFGNKKDVKHVAGGNNHDNHNVINNHGNNHNDMKNRQMAIGAGGSKASERGVMNHANSSAKSSFGNKAQGGNMASSGKSASSAGSHLGRR